MTRRPSCIVGCAQPAPEWRWVGAGVRALLGGLLTAEQGPDSAEPILWGMPSGPVVVLTNQMPFPTTGIEDDLAQRATWSGWREATRAWRSHYAIVRFDPEPAANPRAAAADLLRVGSAVARITRAHMLCWSETGVVHPASDAVERLLEDPLHPEITVRVRWTAEVSATGPRVGAQTRGLEALGLPELEVPPAVQSAVAIHHRLMATARRLIETGPVLQTGLEHGRETALRDEHSAGPERLPIHLIRPAASRTLH